ncbi:MAG: hypothetical protein HFI90_10565 [Clostridia bacterium]|nr:hypothetical protein [Clostridia bacterium]
MQTQIWKKTLRQQEKGIQRAYETVRQDEGTGETVCAAGQWLYDNYYLMQQQLNMIKEEFPWRAFLRQTEDGAVPRVFLRAQEILRHNAALQPETLAQQLCAWNDWYCEELWVLPDAMRLVCFRRLASLCGQVEQTQTAYAAARRAETTYLQDGTLPLSQNHKQRRTYIQHLAQRLRQQGNSGRQAMMRLRKQLEAEGQEPETLSAEEYECQAKCQARMGEAVRALISVRDIDWRTLMEQVCPAEQTLLQDPDGVYAKMDMESRNLYLEELVRLAKKLRKTDLQLAQKALELAQGGQDEQTRHVGYYLVGEGQHLLTGERKPSGAVPRYIAAVVLTALLLGTAAAIWTRSPAVGIVLLIPFLQIAAQMVQMILRPQGRRRGVVKLDIKKCEEMPSVLLVVPALVPNVQRGKELLRQIEQYAYACRLQGIYFALAGDLKEANQQKLPEDDEIAETLCGVVQQMNAGRTRETFFYLQRERQYAPAQKVYTGWERKRGALMELNRLIAGQENGYTVQSGKLPPIDYVLTLDADAVLPYDTAAKLIGAVMHPLNRPQVEQGIVTKGYGIVKPGEVVSVEAAEQTAFTKIFAGRGGISRYASPADYYQLAFGESIYMGKGIYDPKLFLRLLEETVPDNRVLSHDLLEGAFVRCGYAADAVFLESYPAGYLSFMQREHRWIRGDWQLLPFLLPRMRDRQGRRQRNPLSALSRWEILDNLFRSFTPLAQLTALGIAPFCGGWKLAVIALASIFFPAVVTAAKELRRRRGWRNTRRSLRVCLWQFVFLAHQAYVALDAATRTVWRLCVTKKNLLEWTTSAETERKRKDAWTAYQRRMCFSSCMAVYMLFAAMVCPTFWGWNIVLAAIWLAAPYAAWYISRWKERIEEKLVAADRQYLRQTARKMWRYFEDYSRPAAHYIPPDNIQINPPIPPTDQTSPTNIGLALLAALAAWDFGFITKSHMTTYLQRIAGTVDRLEKWNGHLYNWYDTKTLRVLPPRYISTVDSGNLAGDLLALSQGLREAAAQPLQEKENLRQGLLDTLALVQQEGAEINESILHEQDWNRFLQKTLSWLQTIEKSPWQEICIRQVQEIMDEQGMDETCVNNDCLKLANWALNLSEQMDFSALYDKNKGLFTIGYQEEQKQFTPSYYDLLASEARQTSFVAIAKGDVPAEHWQRLSRVPLYKGGRAGLASWSGTMFEYYMPRLLLRNVPHSVFAETYQYVLDAQKQYAQRRGIPWGTSESAYATFDGSWRYQYYAFGNPTLALKSGQGKDAVVAPYATQLALMETPKEAIQNLKWLETLGAGGRYGFYEAVDWTPRRQLRGKDYTVVKSYMVHHLGMGLLAMHDVLQNHAMQRRFLRDARMQSADYLQQERMAERMKKSSRCPETANPVVQMKFHEISCARTVSDLRQDVPEVQLLSNSMFSTLVDSGGGGYLKGGDTMMTRFRALGGAPPYGTFFYCRETGRESWSPALLPVGGAQQYETTFTTHMAAFRAKMEGIVSTYEITVSPEDPLEVRKLTFQNETEQERRLEVTSYVEPCMMRQQADVAHMAFGKLFIRTQYVEDRQMLLAEKRPREAEELPLLLFHQICTPEMDGNITFETSRERFVGRCRSLHEPAALQQSLSCTQGAAVDPCLSLRCTVTIPPQESVTLYYLTGMSRSKEEALQLAQKHRFAASCETVFERSLARSNVVHEYLHISDEEEALAMQLLRHVLYRTPHAQAQVQQSTNKLGQAALWRLGISGDYPIVLCTLKQQAVLPELLLKIHMFWKLRGFACDLVFLLEEQDSYHRPVEEQLRECMNQSQGTESVFICRRELLQSGEEELLRTVARIRLDGGKELDGQLHLPPEVKPPELQQLQGGAVEQQRPPLLFWNGIGGFDPQSGEYVIWLEEDVKTPLPWVNVIAGKQLGFLCSESGSGFTYAYNSREYKLTPWSNDFVEDPPGEWFLLQDVQKGNSWSVTRSPAPSAGVYRIRHGFGYSVYRHDAYEIAGELTVFAAQEQPVKISLIKLKNLGKETRRISIKYHAVPVMGVSEAENARYIQTQQQEGMITVRNCYPSELPDNHMTLCAAGAETAVEEWNRCPCLTLVKTVELEPDACITVPFLMGCGNAAAWQSLQQEKDACTELQHVKAFWTDFLGKIRVETPDESINLLVNGRLLYQTYAARMLARSGFYQTSGAFGFRDQLQDSLALLYGNAPLCKQQILKHAAKQYEEGDVQHWWHDNLDGQETVSRGIRTKFSDDLVWLAYVTAQYVKKTGDTDLLHEQIPFLKDAPLEAEDERYGLAQVSEKTADIYTHCVLAVNRSLQRGSHGLPLMGSGDWNDGMNRVGNHGTGESVWLGFFLYKVMEEFLPLCRLYGDQETEKRYQTELQMLKTALNQTAWDGEWFLRAFFDDGTPLGSRGNEECKIDLIAQSWAVISGAAQPEKAQCAMRAVQEHLVDKENKLIRLLAPAFDTAPMDPGYIKSYLPGVRENGGQYTHAAVWYVWAWAVLGEAAQTAQQWALLNPILHGTTWEEIQQYKTEPYVAAADIYSANGQEGRGGWSWYTGAAGWMYSLLIEMILGIKKEGDKLRIEPVVLPAWKSFRIHYTYGSTVYEITAMQDDEKENTTSIHLQDDGKKHEITIYYKKEAQY